MRYFFLRLVRKSWFSRHNGTSLRVPMTSKPKWAELGRGDRNLFLIGRIGVAFCVARIRRCATSRGVGGTTQDHTRGTISPWAKTLPTLGSEYVTRTRHTTALTDRHSISFSRSWFLFSLLSRRRCLLTVFEKFSTRFFVPCGSGERGSDDPRSAVNAADVRRRVEDGAEEGHRCTRT